MSHENIKNFRNGINIYKNNFSTLVTLTILSTLEVSSISFDIKINDNEATHLAVDKLPFIRGSVRPRERTFSMKQTKIELTRVNTSIVHERSSLAMITLAGDGMKGLFY